ncbi:MurR/RpiR family transcriptional regulator [Liquorilactobacillus satsumensis]|uniref:MurR/RpiR family transcriptional regulator n=1 Tax=Liquorilactobacillus satsumensis TaxID=259059 RepID=UPI001E55D159|nr:MurR/RpiR family transcriptional regulator [Liquorilactobacillus satsumensis]MCC7667255.1 transcriptional regulator [Liquorilactobacillus satsumensis]MCP9358589.1 MurR/RpiR family transcriptional regulator [Liquorilactobacillus satsumensis]MCP9372536.1 MurR/RpiR family transcriptional regulator [Liquorilactobacillus satsumensis]
MENILIVIHSMTPSFSKKEAQLAAFIQEQPQQVVEMSVQSLALTAQVSAATIVRFCRKIGLNGYSELKLALSAIQHSIATDGYREIAPGEDAQLIMNKLETHLTSALELTKKELDLQLIEKVVDLLHTASSVQLFGLVASALPVQDMYQKFNRIGLPTLQNSDLRMAVTCLSAAKDNTLLFCVSNSGETREVIELLRLGHEKNLPTVLLTSNAASTAAQLAEVVLLTKNIGESAIRPGATTSVLMQLFVGDLLLFRYVSKYYETVSANLKATQQNINRIERSRDLK